MKVLLRKFWDEPAVCIAVLAALGTVVYNLVQHQPIDVAQVLALLATGGVTRQLVQPSEASKKKAVK